MKFRRVVFSAILFFTALHAVAQGDLDINTPAISALQQSMQQRYAQLAPFFASGSIGLAGDGNIAIHDAGQVPLSQRGQLNQLVSQENADRAALYREIARANGHPEWESDVRKTFAQRWIGKARAGWWVQQNGGWVQK